MTEKPELDPEAAQSGFTNAVILGFLAYLLLPLIALITVVSAIVLILDGAVLGGIALIVVLQLWVTLGLWAHFRRANLLRRAEAGLMKQATDTQHDDGTTSPADHSP